MSTIVNLSDFNVVPLKQRVGFERYTDPFTDCAVRVSLRIAESLEKKNDRTKSEIIRKLAAHIAPFCQHYNDFFEDQFWEQDTDDALIRAGIIFLPHIHIITKNSLNLSSEDEETIRLPDIRNMLVASNAIYHRGFVASDAKIPEAGFLAHILWLQYLKENAAPKHGQDNIFEASNYARRLSFIQKAINKKLFIGEAIETAIEKLQAKLPPRAAELPLLAPPAIPAPPPSAQERKKPSLRLVEPTKP